MKGSLPKGKPVAGTGRKNHWRIKGRRAGAASGVISREHWVRVISSRWFAVE